VAGGTECQALHVHAPLVCATFARARFHNDKIDLTGEDTFNELILPLGKALNQAS
jgi:hypothetical protein